MQVTLDIFSGMPNPVWDLSGTQMRELLERLSEEPSVIAAAQAEVGLLGYRGFIVEADTDTDRAALLRAGLPARFRVVGGVALGDAPGVEVDLLGVAAQHLPDDLVGVAEAAITDPSPLMRAELAQLAADGHAVSTSSACSIYRTSSTSYSFWNDSPHRANNNCYNYASNWRTGTFAQPGRGTGRMFSQLTASDIFAAAARDGYKTSCSGTNLYVALAIWPNRDYHWWRRTANVNNAARWSHKPGSTAARNTDNSGRVITSPYGCDRGSYTTWGGYRYGPGSSVSSVA